MNPPAPPSPLVSSTLASDTKYNGFPWCCTTGAAGAGSIVAVYREGATHDSVDGKVTLQTSTDGGATWTAKNYIASPAAGHDYRDPSIARTSTGRLIVNFFDANGPAVLGLYTIQSDDAGATWSAPALIASPYTSWTATSGGILAHSSGDLLMPVYGRATGDTEDRAGIISSTDNGATWGSLVSITAASGGFSEATLIELASTSVVAFIRDNAASTPIVKSTSADVGATWSAPASLGFNVYPGRPSAAIAASGTIVLFYRQEATIESVYRYSLDAGATWSTEQLYSPNFSMYAGGHILTGVGLAFVASLQISASVARVLFRSFVA